MSVSLFASSCCCMVLHGVVGCQYAYTSMTAGSPQTVLEYVPEVTYANKQNYLKLTIITGQPL